MVTSFLKIAKKFEKKMFLQPQWFITEERKKNKKRVFIPTVGMPQSTDFDLSSYMKKEIRKFNAKEVYLIYDDLKIRDNWLLHLEYLDKWLDVDTIKKQDFVRWLKEN